MASGDIIRIGSGLWDKTMGVVTGSYYSPSTAATVTLINITGKGVAELSCWHNNAYDIPTIGNLYIDGVLMPSNTIAFLRNTISWGSSGGSISLSHFTFNTIPVSFKTSLVVTATTYEGSTHTITCRAIYFI